MNYLVFGKKGFELRGLRNRESCIRKQIKQLPFFISNGEEIRLLPDLKKLYPVEFKYGIIKMQRRKQQTTNQRQKWKKQFRSKYIVPENNKQRNLSEQNYL